MSISSEYRRDVAKAILRKRIESGYSINNLAIKADITREDVKKYERGLKAPTINTAARIAVALDCTMDELFMHEGA